MSNEADGAGTVDGRPRESAPGPARDGDAAGRVFAGPGEMRALCRGRDWAATPLGPVEGWPASLRTAAGLVLAAPGAMILLWGPELVQVYNDAYRELMGGKHPAGLGQSNQECWPEVWEFNEPLFGDVIRRAAVFTFTDQRLVLERHGHPEEAFFTLTYSPVPDDGGSVGGVLATVFETTAQVRARGAREHERERLLRVAEASEARYRMLFESIDVGFCAIEVIFDAEERAVDYRFLEANPAFEGQTGLVDAVGHTARELLPTLEAHWFETYGRVAATGEAVRFQNGSEAMGRWFDVYAFRIGAPEERRVAILFTDVTAAHAAERERERLLAELGAERERLRSIVLQMPAPLALLVGPEHRFDIVNPAYRRVSGGGRDVTGLTPPEAFPELEGQGIYELFDRVYETGEPWSGPETPVRFDRDGDGIQDTWFDLHFQPVRDAEGRVVAIFNFAVDVTDQVRARREVERLLAESEHARADAEAARSEAEAANRAKSEFLAVMSHELRTPLNAIGGYAELIEMGIRGPVTAQQQEDLRRIQTSQRHLLGLINEVLNYARLETGTVHFDLADVPVREAVIGAELLVAPQARSKGLTLAVTDCAPDLEVRADAEKLRQIVVNLLSNAVKFTDPGGHVEVSCDRDDARVRVRVRDTGIGIPADKIAAIFDPFVQVRADLTRPHEGTGLGLAISRDLARGMGGDLVAESTPGVGSTFTLTLPAA